MIKSEKREIEDNLSLKIYTVNIVITILISTISSVITILIVTNQPNMSQSQSVNINSIVVEQVDINTASKEELKSLPGIGEVLADSIIANRPYTSIHDLKNIEGLGDTIFYSICEKVIVND